MYEFDIENAIKVTCRSLSLDYQDSSKWRYPVNPEDRK